MPSELVNHLFLYCSMTCIMGGYPHLLHIQSMPDVERINIQLRQPYLRVIVTITVWERVVTCCAVGHMTRNYVVHGREVWTQARATYKTKLVFVKLLLQSMHIRLSALHVHRRARCSTRIWHGSPCPQPTALVWPAVLLKHPTTCIPVHY